MIEKDQENAKKTIFASKVGIALNILLAAGKLIVGAIAHSMSIISDGLNNFTDAGSAVVTMAGLKLSQKRADEDHPWGHGRMEYVTAFIIDIIIILVGVELFRSSFDKILNPEFPEINMITIGILIVAIIAKLGLFVFYTRVAKKTGSSAIKAVAYDSISDTVATFVVLISGIVAKVFGYNIDGYVSMLVSIFIFITGIKAIKEVIDILLGAKPDEEFVNSIYEYSKNYELIHGIHDIMVHDYGPGRKIVSFHAEIPETENIGKAHDVIDQMEEDMYKEFGCITTIHMDPIKVNDEKINSMKDIVEKIVKEINSTFSIHDFRMTDGGDRVNLIFDLVIPRDKNIKKEEVEQEVKDKISKINPTYHAVIKVEGTFI